MNGKGPASQRIKGLATGQRIGSAVVTGQAVCAEGSQTWLLVLQPGSVFWSALGRRWALMLWSLFPGTLERDSSPPGAQLAGSQELLTGGRKGRFHGFCPQLACDWRPCLDLALALTWQLQEDPKVAGEAGAWE